MSNSGPYPIYQDGKLMKEVVPDGTHTHWAHLPINLDELILLIQRCVTEEVEKQLREKRRMDNPTGCVVVTMQHDGPMYTSFKLPCDKCSNPQGCQCQDCRGAGYE